MTVTVYHLSHDVPLERSQQTLDRGLRPIKRTIEQSEFSRCLLKVQRKFIDEHSEGKSANLEHYKACPTIDR